MLKFGQGLKGVKKKAFFYRDERLLIRLIDLSPSRQKLIPKLEIKN